MRSFKNIQTGAVVTVPRVKNVKGSSVQFISNDGTKIFAQCFVSRYAEVFSHDVSEGFSLFSVNDGWELVQKTKKERQQNPEKKEKATPKKRQQKAIKQAETEKEKKQEEEKKQNPEKPAFRHPMLEELIDNIENDRLIGRFPFLHGPAGSGKSTLAQKAAEALNLPFFSVSSLQQKYELEGYTDAVGKYVETAFYHAFKFGGVFCFDELTTSPGEVLIAFNTACAQLIYNFPKEGLVHAHPDFHIVACDNTTGTGKSSSYTARFILDASTRDRFTLLEVNYTREFDLFMAQGNTELVDFCEDLREALKLSNMYQYLATPRAEQAFCAFQKIKDKKTGERKYNDDKCLQNAFFGGWTKTEKQTILSAMQNTDNRYYKVFQKLAK